MSPSSPRAMRGAARASVLSMGAFSGWGGAGSNPSATPDGAADAGGAQVEKSGTSSPHADSSLPAAAPALTSGNGSPRVPAGTAGQTKPPVALPPKGDYRSKSPTLSSTSSSAFFAGSGHYNGHHEVIAREQPELPTRLDRGTTVSFQSRAGSRFAERGEQLISLQNPQTIVVSATATGVVHRRIVRTAAEGSPASTVTALCANEKTLACGTSAGTVEIYKPGAASAEIVSLGEAGVEAIAMPSRGEVVLAGDAEGSLFWIERSRASLKGQKKEGGPIHAIAVSPDGRLAATVDNEQTVRIWDIAGQTLQQTLGGHESRVGAVAFSPDGQSLLSGDARGELVRWDVTTGKKIASYEFRRGLVRTSGSPVLEETGAGGSANDVANIPRVGGITALEFRRDQKVAAAGTSSGYTQTFDLERGAELSPVFHRSPVTDLAFAADGASLLVATQSGEATRWWSAPDPPRLLEGHQGSVRFAALDSTGQRGVTAGVDRQLRVWDVEQGLLVQSLDSGGEAITAGALSTDGTRAVTGGYGSGITLWDLSGMKSLGKRFGHKKRVWWFDFAPDGSRFASGSDDQTVKVWDFASQRLIRTIEHDAPVRFVRFSPEGARLATSTLDPRGWQFPARLQVWNAETGKLLVELRGHRAAVNAAVFSPDGSELTSCGADGQVCRWKVATGERLQDDSRPHGLSHAGLIGGEFLVMRRFNTGVFVDRPGTLQRLLAFDVPTRSIGDLHVATRGHRIIAGTEEGAVYVWSLRHE